MSNMNDLPASQPMGRAIEYIRWGQFSSSSRARPSNHLGVASAHSARRELLVKVEPRDRVRDSCVGVYKETWQQADGGVVFLPFKRGIARPCHPSA